MMFTKRLRDGVRRGRIRCSIRVWKQCHVKVGGRYPMDQGHIVVDSIASIERSDITEDLARESGFESVSDLLEIAIHGGGKNVYLIRFHYLAAAPLDVVHETRTARDEKKTLLQRIRGSAPPLARSGRKRPAAGRGRKS
jgi:hypothetical protein